MALYNKDTKLSEAVMAHPELIPVIDRLGVSLGVGDYTIGSICLKEHIDSDFFLSVINTFLNNDYFPINGRGTFTLEKTIDYLRKTSRFYLHVQLPNIERHFNSLISRSGTDNNLHLLQDFFEEMKGEMTECIEYDEGALYPALGKEEVPAGVEKMVRGHAEVEEKLNDLLYFFVVHLQGNYDSNLCMAVVSAVSALMKDYRQNNRIRNRILLPVIEEMKRKS